MMMEITIRDVDDVDAEVVAVVAQIVMKQTRAQIQLKKVAPNLMKIQHQDVMSYSRSDVVAAVPEVTQ